MPPTQRATTFATLPIFLGDTNAERRSHYFFTTNDVGSLHDLLVKPYQHFVEMREYVHLSKVLDFIRNEHPHMSISLTTEAAFKQPMADFFVAFVSKNSSLSEDTVSNIKTCLQEAVMNAIIHGNLKVEHAGDEANGFQHYLDQISVRIEDELLGLQRVSVYAWLTNNNLTLCVSDQGKGFDIQPKPFDDTKPYGRGLSLIHCLSSRVWQTQPNNIYMQFKLHG